RRVELFLGQGRRATRRRLGWCRVCWRRITRRLRCRIAHKFLVTKAPRPPLRREIDAALISRGRSRIDYEAKLLWRSERELNPQPGGFGGFYPPSPFPM